MADITGMITKTVAGILEARMALAGCPVRCEPGCGPDGQRVATYTGRGFEARYDGVTFYWRLDGAGERPWIEVPTSPICGRCRGKGPLGCPECSGTGHASLSGRCP